MPFTYTVRWDDGFEYTAWEDELLTAPAFYTQDDPPAPPRSDNSYARKNWRRWTMPRFSNAVPDMPSRGAAALAIGFTALWVVMAVLYPEPAMFAAAVICASTLAGQIRAWRFWRARPEFAALTAEFRRLVKEMDEYPAVYRTVEHGGALLRRHTTKLRFVPTYWAVLRLSDEQEEEMQRGSEPGDRVAVISDVFTCPAATSRPVGLTTEAQSGVVGDDGEPAYDNPRRFSTLWSRSPFGKVYRSGVLHAGEDDLRIAVEQIRAAYRIEDAEAEQ